MDDFRQELIALEESLWRAETRFDVAYMNSVLAAGFTEFGQSGRTYDRDEVIAVPAADFSATLPLAEFEVRMVTDDVALVTYCSDVSYGDQVVSANRASVWRRDGSGWLLEFHQGTPARRRV